MIEPSFSALLAQSTRELFAQPGPLPGTILLDERSEERVLLRRPGPLRRYDLVDAWRLRSWLWDSRHDRQRHVFRQRIHAESGFEPVQDLGFELGPLGSWPLGMTLGILAPW